MMTIASVMLENPEIRARVAPVAVEQYHRFPEFNANGRRTELIRGILIEKISKSPLHSSIASRLFMLLQGAKARVDLAELFGKESLDA